MGVVVLRAEIVPRWMGIALIVPADLLSLYTEQAPGASPP
jgi:hypothetical protein